MQLFVGFVYYLYLVLFSFGDPMRISYFIGEKAGLWFNGSMVWALLGLIGSGILE